MQFMLHSVHGQKHHNQFQLISVKDCVGVLVKTYTFYHPLTRIFLKLNQSVPRPAFSFLFILNSLCKTN